MHANALLQLETDENRLFISEKSFTSVFYFVYHTNVMIKLCGMHCIVHIYLCNTDN